MTARYESSDPDTFHRTLDRALAKAAGVTAEQKADSDRMRGAGGNRFIEADATRADLMRSINDQLGDLHEWAEWSDRVLDLAELTISTKRIKSGRISVSVTADLARSTGHAPDVTP